MRGINHQDFVGMVLIKVFSCRVPEDLPLIPKKHQTEAPRWGGGGDGPEEEGVETQEDPRIAVGKQQGNARMIIFQLQKKSKNCRRNPTSLLQSRVSRDKGSDSDSRGKDGCWRW